MGSLKEAQSDFEKRTQINDDSNLNKLIRMMEQGKPKKEIDDFVKDINN